MRLPWLALLCAGTVAFCQAPAPRKVDPDKLFEMPKKFTPAEREFGKLSPLPFVWNQTILERPTMITPLPDLNSPQIDPKIIVHPLWRNESKGQEVSHRLYPNLKFLPLHREVPVPR